MASGDAVKNSVMRWKGKNTTSVWYTVHCTASLFALYFVCRLQKRCRCSNACRENSQPPVRHLNVSPTYCVARLIMMKQFLPLKSNHSYLLLYSEESPMRTRPLASSTPVRSLHMWVGMLPPGTNATGAAVCSTYSSSSCTSTGWRSSRGRRRWPRKSKCSRILHYSTCSPASCISA